MTDLTKLCVLFSFDVVIPGRKKNIIIHSIVRIAKQCKQAVAYSWLYYNNSEKFRINYRSHAFFYMFSKDNNRIPLSHTGFDVINEGKDFTTYFPQLVYFYLTFRASVYVCVIMASCAAFLLQCLLLLLFSYGWYTDVHMFTYMHACFFVSISVFLPCWSALFNSAPLSFSLYAFFEVNLKDQHQSFISYKRACCLLM